MPPPKISVVIPTRNEGPYLPFTVYWVLVNSGYPNVEVLIVDDGSTDDSVKQVISGFGQTGLVRVLQGECRGPGQARNLGAYEATGEIVIFIDAHCYTPPGWIPSLVSPLANPEVALVGCGFTDLVRPSPYAGMGCTWTTPALDLVWLPSQSMDVYPVPLLPGGCQAMRKADFANFGYYEKGTTHIGSEGEEQSLRCWLMGYSVVVQPKLVVRHLFREQAPYHAIPGKLIYNRLRIAMLHFSQERIERVLGALKALPCYSEELELLRQSDVEECRTAWRRRRVRSDDWFFKRFGILV